CKQAVGNLSVCNFRGPPLFHGRSWLLVEPGKPDRQHKETEKEDPMSKACNWPPASLTGRLASGAESGRLAAG
ncbi:MAG TPA: hypothetical protein VNH16_23240, partial [Burkholderiales bacterium]|nr:hypothetical protein [Burkholderiales bacterium]